MFGNDKNNVAVKRNMDVLDIMLKALADIEDCRQVFEEMIMKSCESYKKAAEDYYGGIQAEIAARRIRFEALDEEIKALTADRNLLNSELGEALVNGNLKAEAEAEQKLQAIDQKIEDIRKRKEIFLGAKVPTGNDALFAELEKRYTEFETVANKYGKFVEGLFNAKQKSDQQLKKILNAFCRDAIFREGHDLDTLCSRPMHVVVRNYGDVYMTFRKYDINKLRECHEGKAIMSEVMG